MNKILFSNKKCDKFKDICGGVIRFSGIPYLIREIVARNKVTILVYHKPSCNVMSKHLEYLSRRYNFINMADLLKAISSGRWEDLPEKSVIITFDDGHKSNYGLMDLFKKYKVQPLIYLCSGIVDTARRFWWMTEGLENRETVNKLKKVPSSSRTEYLEKYCGFNKEKEFLGSVRQALNKSEIIEMSPYVEWGSHSKFHPVLTNCSFEECEDEITVSASDIRGLTGKECVYFSYPNGDYSQREAALVKKAGYVCARTVISGWNGPDTDLFKLKVQEIADDASINWLSVQISGISWWLKRFIGKE